MKFTKTLALALFFIFIFSSAFSSHALEIKEPRLEINAKSAVLMDVNTGTVLYGLNMDEKLPPASVTKVMTLLLIFEAIDDGRLRMDNMLTVSEYAASMGGSQVFLEPGEQMCVDDLIKCVVVASANDAAVTLAEAVSGSEEAFVHQMNARAKELGMNNTCFENVTGLDDDTTNHLTSAHDIAIMSRELLKHEKIMEYTTIWMDTIRNGEFGLSNTNRLVKYYRGATGLKTGYTRGAGFCVSASAKRGDLHLIAVIMGADTSNDRNVAAAKLLDYGFATYGIYKDVNRICGEVNILRGEKRTVTTKCNDFTLLENLGNESKITSELVIEENLTAPITKGQTVGKVVYKIDGKTVGENPVLANEDVCELSFAKIFVNLLKNIVS